ncbi:YhdP family protein [Luteimonas deserti]|uniref:TIGR02099 family protein n=1 Tax=Luteimonas deserti TaxID=2752306 RepID=A0A7Z0QRQ9_9GAMM|nr:YhdP family protein [Luteimonas deserti]NYZ62627.1 TIGR02099 family protein [Luteimonas deserti]
MSAAWPRRLRRVHAGAWYTVAASLVLVAIVAVVLAQLALPWVERNPRAVERWLSERSGRPVAFDTLDTRWTRRGPLLQVTGLRIGEAGAGVPVARAEIQVSPYTGLWPGRSLTELRLHGLDLTLVRADDGRWQVRGLPGASETDDDPLAALEGLGELQVIGARLAIDAPSLALRHTLPRVDLRLRVDRRRARAAARAWIEDGAAPLDLRLNLDRREGTARAYVAMPRNDLQVWSPLLAPTGVAIHAGHGRVAVWLELEERRVVAATADVALDTLVLQRADTAEPAAADTVGFDGVQARLRWSHADGDWRIDAPRLRIVQQRREQVLDGLVVAGGGRWAMQAARVEIAPLLALLGLGDRVPETLRAWLNDAAPHAVLSDVEFAAVPGGPMRLSARVDALGFAPVDTRPGIDGLAGTLAGDGHGLVFRPDPAAAITFDWPVGFGDPHRVRLHGDVVAWRDGGDWQVATPGLRVEGEGYAADARGGVTFQGDASRPRMDLAARVDTSAIPVARRFWVRHTMPEAAREWLDMALVSGDVQGGRAVVAGDLDDWPFSAADGDDRKGVFTAEARLSGASIRFQPDWPAMDALSGRLRFLNDGFVLDEASGELGGVPVRDIEASMARYSTSPVLVRASAGTDATRLLGLLRRSPFHARHAEILDNLDVRGPARAAVTVTVPHGAPVVIDGSVRLDGVAVRESRFHLAFAEVRGEGRFDNDGFAAERLAVRRDGETGTLGLRAGDGHVRDRAQAFEAELDMRLSASELLARAPDLDWLRPHVTGSAPWRVQVTVPDGPDGAQPAQLLLRSDLAGTALALPAPLDKPAQQPLRTTIETALPFDAGDISVAFGDRLAVRARTRGERTGVRVAFGSGRVLQAPPATGLAVGGRTPVLDLVDWLGLRRGGDGEGLTLQALDLTAGDLRLPGARLGQTRLTAARRDGGTALRLDGAALAGDLHLPDADGAPVIVALQRLHWPAPTPKPEAAAATPARVAEAGPSPADAMDPSALPPLQLRVDELRVGAMALGSATARTRRIPGGLQVETLRIRAPQHRIDVDGRWTGRGASARTALEAGVESEDFGRLLSGLGFAGSIVGGQGRVDLQAGWGGGPAAFDVASLEGVLQLTIKDGQLVEVEPGAGRVLGLLSLTELPRRLTLDFRDFFNRGFGFSRIAGDVRFARGQARSDGLTIDGPAAEIRIRGSADLAARTHNQTIEVLPKTGNLLPAVGALTAGPVGAAVGAVANAVLRRPLAEMGARNYHVSGPWQDPKVEVVERRDGAQAAPGRPPAPRPQAAD